MAKKKVQEYKVDYKGLVKEINRTLRKLDKIKGKVVEDEQKDIDLQIQYLDYLVDVCAKGTGKMTKAYRAKMTGCTPGLK
jgi:exosome complex RNA-binding protein Csl4